MSLNEEERKIMVGLEYEKALHTLDQMDLLISNEVWDFAANGLYYALFHAVSALLINDGHTAETHKGKVIVFGQHYVKTGVFSQEDGKLYSRLQTMREQADYNCAFIASRDEVEPFVQLARDFVSRIRARLTMLDDK